jgi:hypothetical protein
MDTVGLSCWRLHFLSLMRHARYWLTHFCAHFRLSSLRMARTFHACFLLPLMARWVTFIFYLVVIVNVQGYVVHCQCSGTAHPIRLQSRALVYGALSVCGPPLLQSEANVLAFYADQSHSATTSTKRFGSHDNNRIDSVVRGSYLTSIQHANINLLWILTPGMVH